MVASPKQILWRPSRNYNMDVIYSAISRGHDNVEDNSAHIFRYFQIFTIRGQIWDSAHENVGGSGSG